MADIPNAANIKALVSLLAPGFIIMSLRSRANAGPVQELPDRLLSYGFISAAYFAGATPLFSEKGGIALTAWQSDFLQYFGLPLVLGVISAYAAQAGLEYALAKKLKLHLAHHIPAAWDYTFNSLEEGTFVLVTLADGTTFRGLMGEHSFASSSREERDILLEEVWAEDASGTWTALQPRRSVLLCGKDIRYVEIF